MAIRLHQERKAEQFPKNGSADSTSEINPLDLSLRNRCQVSSPKGPADSSSDKLSRGSSYLEGPADSSSNKCRSNNSYPEGPADSSMPKCQAFKQAMNSLSLTPPPSPESSTENGGLSGKNAQAFDINQPSTSQNSIPWPPPKTLTNQATAESAKDQSKNMLLVLATIAEQILKNEVN